jgi:hypothetical protein
MADLAVGIPPESGLERFHYHRADWEGRPSAAGEADEIPRLQDAVVENYSVVERLAVSEARLQPPAANLKRRIAHTNPPFGGFFDHRAVQIHPNLAPPTFVPSEGKANIMPFASLENRTLSGKDIANSRTIRDTSGQSPLLAANQPRSNAPEDHFGPGCAATERLKPCPDAKIRRCLELWRSIQEIDAPAAGI